MVLSKRRYEQQYSDPNIHNTSLLHLFVTVIAYLFPHSDDNVCSAIGLTYRAIAQHNQDILINYLDRVVPLTFFAMHKKKSPGM